MKDKDNYIKMVYTFHKVFNHPIGEHLNTANQTLAKQRADYMRSEIDEYLEAVEANNIVDIADTLADLMYFLCGTIVVHGLDEDFNRIFSAVHNSNMSKICITEKEAIDTVEHYSQGTHYAAPGIIYDCFYEKIEEEDYDYYVVKKRDDLKVMKSIKWIRPEIMIESIIATSLKKKK